MAIAQQGAEGGPLASRADNVSSYATWMAILVLAAIVLIVSARGTRPRGSERTWRWPRSRHVRG